MSKRSAVRGRLLTFTADPAEAGAQASHRYWKDGVVAIEGGTHRRGGRGGGSSPAPAGRHAGRSLSGPARPARPDRHPHSFSADAGDCAPMASSSWNGCRSIPSSRNRSSLIPPMPDGWPGSSSTSCSATARPRRWSIAPSAPEFGRGVLRRKPPPQRADDRRQGDDGPRRAGRAARHCPAGLRRDQGADRRLARAGPATLRDHTALRPDLDRGTARGGRRIAARAPRLLPADPSGREPRGDRGRPPALSAGHELHRHLRPLRPARAALAVRPLHPSRRGGTRPPVGDAARSRRSARPPTCSSAAVCSTSPRCATRVGRSGSASPPTSAAAPATRCCARRPRPTRCCSSAARTCRRSTPFT